jgi:hypothetical protein
VPGRSETRGGIIPPENDDIRKWRIEYVLFQVIKNPQQILGETGLSKQLDTYAREALEFNTATARHLCQEMAAEGLLKTSGEGRTVCYTITPAGWLNLGNAIFPPNKQFKLNGRTLHRLLEAAREVGKQFAPTGSTLRPPPSTSELEEAIIAAFEERLRERYSLTGLVPIWEVRAEIRNRFGDTIARHDVFDKAVLDLWRATKIQLTPITDYAKATPTQLQDGIPGLGETLFYLEAAHATATL